MQRSLTIILGALLLAAARSQESSEIFALDGHGAPVAWWAVLKLPTHARVDGRSEPQPTPCDCPPPDCSNVATRELNTSARATGLCYLYADAKNPTFRHFRELGYDCLGQGANDPVSHTLRQMSKRQHQDEKPPYWAYFNDQFNGIAQSYEPKPSAREKKERDICSGGSHFSAHAKGALGFHEATGGFFLQTSTPSFPDPSKTAGDDEFVRLGCQADDNVLYAQHLLALSLDMPNLNALGAQLQTARLCSGNYYRDDLHDLLASTSFYADGSNASEFGALYTALLDPALAVVDQSSVGHIELKQSQSLEEKTTVKTPVFLPIYSDSMMLTDVVNPRDSAKEEKEEVLVIVKSPRATVPPWALIADILQSDVSVASWWDGDVGIPNICAGDSYANTPNQFCLNNPAHGVHLSADGTAEFNVENLIEASYVDQTPPVLGLRLNRVSV